MTIGTLALVALGLLAFWMLGGVALRVTGALLLVVALIGMATQPQAMGLIVLVLGLLLWLAGHWHYALRYHAYKSPLAQRIFLQLLPSRLDPTRGWTIPTVDRDAY